METNFSKNEKSLPIVINKDASSAKNSLAAFQTELSSENSLEIKIRTQSPMKIGDYLYYTPCIGKGSFSRVFIGHKIGETSRYVAIKRTSISQAKKMSMDRLKREIKILKTIDHPNIVKFYDAFTDVAHNVYIITEFCNYGNLSKYIDNEKLDENTIRKYMTQFKDGLYYLLSNNIVHRDIKPENILLHKDKDGNVIVKIADLGFAKCFDNLEEETMLQTLCGTPMYLAPEVLGSKKYTIVSDLWSVGIIIYQLLFHTTPFLKPRNLLELIRNIDEMELVYPSPISETLSELLDGLLTQDPANRLTWGNFFIHKWFQEVTVVTMECTKDEVNEHDKSRLYDIDSSDEELDENNDDGDLLKKLFSKKKEVRRIDDGESYVSEQSSALFSPIHMIDGYAGNSIPRENRIVRSLSNSLAIKQHDVEQKNSFSISKATITSSVSPVLKFLSNSFSLGKSPPAFGLIHNIFGSHK